jgi:hypothetical protein
MMSFVVVNTQSIAHAVSASPQESENATAAPQNYLELKSILEKHTYETIRQFEDPVESLSLGIYFRYYSYIPHQINTEWEGYINKGDIAIHEWLHTLYIKDLEERHLKSFEEYKIGDYDRVYRGKIDPEKYYEFLEKIAGSELLAFPKRQRIWQPSVHVIFKKDGISFDSSYNERFSPEFFSMMKDELFIEHGLGPMSEVIATEDKEKLVSKIREVKLEWTKPDTVYGKRHLWKDHPEMFPPGVELE